MPNDRRKTGEIFAQVLSPRFGDGVDVVIGPGRRQILEATRALGLDLETALSAKGFVFADSMDAVPAAARRTVVLFSNDAFDRAAATQRALDLLSGYPRGSFLMVELQERGLDPESGG